MLIACRFPAFAICNFRAVHTSAVTCAIMTKKVKRLDSDTIRIREERKRKKLKKSMAELEQFSRNPKPLEELHISSAVLASLPDRERERTEMTFEESEFEATSLKDYQRLRKRHHDVDKRRIERMMDAQHEALVQLRAISETLYQDAIAIDDSLVPFRRQGPTETPPLANYKSPDGDYIDITRKWD